MHAAVICGRREPMRIAFVMPEISPRPVGGAKAVYRYATELAARGHQVTVLHPRRSVLAGFRQRFDHDSAFEPAHLAPQPWYQLGERVVDWVIDDIAADALPGDFDVIIANNCRVVAAMTGFSERLGRKVYFLQDYESFQIGDAQHRAETLGLLRIDWPVIVSSPAARRLVESASGRPCLMVRRAIDTDQFRAITPLDSPLRTTIGFPARSERTKCTGDAIRALEIARTRLPRSTGFWCYGYERPRALPSWITHHLAPTDQELCASYNRSCVFLVPSRWEGFGQPGAEAMACGVALVSTRNGGVDTYATDGESAILCAPGRPAELAAAALCLYESESSRLRIARTGAAAAARLTWTAAADALDALLRTICASRG